MVFKQIPTYSKMSLTTASFLNHVHNTGRRKKNKFFSAVCLFDYAIYMRQGKSIFSVALPWRRMYAPCCGF